jgi:hypothetical protein
LPVEMGAVEDLRVVVQALNNARTTIVQLAHRKFNLG